MENKNMILENTKNAILAKAISYITIIDVDSKINCEGDLMLYVKTNNISTVELDKLSDAASNLSNKKISVSVMVPSGKYTKGIEVKENLDTVCIFIEYN